MSNLPDVKIYFGRLPHGTRTQNLDAWMVGWLPHNDFSIQDTLKDVLSTYCLKNRTSPEAFHTLNPLYVNYLDEDYAKRNVWFIDTEGNEILMGEDPVCLEKFECLHAGEILSDDARIFQDD